jgi:hypothetical protein
MLAAIEAGARGAGENKEVLQDEGHEFSGAVVGDAAADVSDYFKSSTRRIVLARGGRGRRKEKVQKPQITKPVQNQILVLIILEVCKASGDDKEEEEGDCC